MANRLENTVHLYELSEIRSTQKGGIRKGIPYHACFAAAESDLSGKGNAAFGTNFISLTEDIGIANPTASINLVIFYNNWISLMKKNFKSSTGKSFTLKDARNLLIGSTVFLTRCNKSRLCYNASIVSLRNCIDEIKDMNPDDYPKNNGLNAACGWVSTLGPPQKNTSGTGLDIQRIIKLFVLLLEKTSETWDRVFKKKKGISTPDEEDKSLEELEEGAVVLETTLLTMAQMIYAVDTIEKRKVPYKKPEFIANALKILPNDWDKQFPKITGKSEKVFNRPIVWCFAILLEKAAQEQKKVLIITLLSLLEMCALDFGNDRMNFISAVLFTVRDKTITWNLERTALENFLSDKDAQTVLSLYEQCPPDSDDGRDPEKLAERRALRIPSEYIDRNTFRGKGKDTLAFLEKDATESGIDITKWSEEERAKSHGLGSKLNKKPSQGEPTFTSFSFDTCFEPSPTLCTIPDPYKKVAREILLEQEEASDLEGTGIDQIASKCYGSWVKLFPCELPVSDDSAEDQYVQDDQDDEKVVVQKPSRKRKTSPNQEEEEKEETSKSSKKSGATGTKKRKKPQPPTEKDQEDEEETKKPKQKPAPKKKPAPKQSVTKQPTQKGKKTSKSQPSTSNSSISDKREPMNQDQGEEEQVIIVRRKGLEGKLNPLQAGQVIRIKKIMYEELDEISEKETETVSKQKVQLQKSKTSAGEQGSSEEEEEEKKIKKGLIN